MSKEAIVKIKQAEEEAAARKQAVSGKVAAMLQEAEKTGEQLYSEKEKEALRKAKEITAEAKGKAEKRIAESSRLAQEDAAAMTAKAEKKMPDAVKIIVEGIVKQWQ